MAADCPLCSGTGRLLDSVLEDVCPLCEGDPLAFTEEVPQGTSESQVGDNEETSCNQVQAEKMYAWEIDLGTWVRYDPDTEALILEAEAAGHKNVRYSARRQDYLVDMCSMVQINVRTGARRRIRRVEVDDEDDEEESDADIAAPPRCERQERLVERLLSPEVQVPLPVEAAEEPDRLSKEEVRKVILDHVQGVERFLYRDMPGMYSLPMIVKAYTTGLPAFEGTPVHRHLLWLLRLTVHHGHAEKPEAARHLREVAEAFMDCQAVQARVIERVGLEIRGVRADFHGLVMRLVGDYKSMALKMLAADRIRRRFASDDGNPTHYENRLTADLGKQLGLNQDDIRRASLDEHAAVRFQRLDGRDLKFAAARCRELFDIEAVIKALMAEVNSFSEHSPKESLPHQFLEWASTRLQDKHIVFNEEDCTCVAVGEPLALAVVEDLFLGKPSAPPEEMYRGTSLQSIFKPS